MKTTIALGTRFLGFAAVLLPSLSPALTNGGFEDDLAGWATSGNVEIKAGAPYAPHEGAKLVAFNAMNRTPDGVIRQPVETEILHPYRVAFWAGNFGYAAKPQRLRVLVNGNIGGIVEPLLDATVEIPGTTKGGTRWTYQTFVFTASRYDVELLFQDVSSYTNGMDLVLDDVRITPLPLGEIRNGGFEDGLNGWNAGGNVETKSSSPYLAAEGVSLAVFNSANREANGWLHQDVPTTDGQRYRLTFEVGNLSYNTRPQSMLVLVGPWGYKQYQVAETVEIPGPGGGATAWISASYDFTAHGSYTGVTFIDQSSSTNALDLVLDDVRLTPIPTHEQFTNGSFEDGLEGWEVSETYGSVSVESAPPYVATDGGSVVAFSSENRGNFGEIRQTVPVTPGRTYRVMFDVGNLAYRNGVMTLRCYIDFGAHRIVNRAFDVWAPSTKGGTRWLRDQFIEFTALTDEAIFTFHDNSYLTDGIDLVFDNVRLVPVSP